MRKLMAGGLPPNINQGIFRDMQIDWGDAWGRVKEGGAAMRSNAYCGNLLWQSSLTLQTPVILGDMLE